ncbi:hypothetical protein Ddye_023423 [Dipteronia dyeriana]|uniref:Formin-like protein n=1 Tax=Dipteronia dyeriana TaxID=168575 RepID=A0AAD9TSV5_9ROSI|nr:hypothetical protein Ddye_023423 [Dipteronia dyeriana]
MATMLLIFTLLSTTDAAGNQQRRRHLLHQPFFPVINVIPPTQPPSQSPSPSPQPPHKNHHRQQQLPKYPFSTTPPNTPQRPFFPSYQAPPPPPLPPSPSILSTFPANISSLLFPNRHSSDAAAHRHVVLLSVSLSLLFAAALTSILAILLYFRRRRSSSGKTSSRSDSQRLFPPNLPPSDGNRKNAQRSISSSNPPSTSSEFLYLGTLVNSRSSEETAPTANATNVGVKIGVSTSPTAYQKLGSPELKPLPPLPKNNSSFTSGEMCFSREETKFETTGDSEEDEDEDEEEFFSPRGSSGRTESPSLGPGPERIGSSSKRENFGSRSFNSRTASYPYTNSNSPSNSISSSCHSPVRNLSPKSISSSVSLKSGSADSPDAVSNFTAQNRQLLLPTRTDGDSKPLVSIKLPPPPPPPPPPLPFWEEPGVAKPSSGIPILMAPSKPVVVQNLGPGFGNEQLMKNESVEKSEVTALKPKLKPLHWDKVRASSDRAMVWDQLKSSSFQLNEEMIETLFMVNNSNLNPKDNGWRQILPSSNQDNRVLDPKKSQNIAILLRALNVTIDEVCEAFLEGNSDTLGTELLESLLKMAPTKEEECKIKEVKDESPFKLGPAEKFLKAVLDIPFAFKRVDAMLYITNFDSEVEYLKRSFETLEAACEELRKSRMFLKLLEAVLKTGNRMNVGTIRGDAQAFKLDTLLKLVDVKGTDGKTTLLHFVVQEIIRAEGSRFSGANQNLKAEKTEKSALQDDVQFRKLGLQVVSGLSGELTSVKKAAAMDSDVLSSDVVKLAAGVTKIMEVLKLNEETAMKDRSRRFSESMNSFLKKAEQEIISIQSQESVALSNVKEITEYFHGNSAKEEAHPFRIFMVVKDFLSILDQVCKDVGKINERTIYSSVRPVPVNATALPPAFPAFVGRLQYGSSDDESTFSS